MSTASEAEQRFPEKKTILHQRNNGGKNFHQLDPVGIFLKLVEHIPHCNDDLNKINEPDELMMNSSK